MYEYEIADYLLKHYREMEQILDQYLVAGGQDVQAFRALYNEERLGHIVQEVALALGLPYETVAATLTEPFLDLCLNTTL